MEQEYARHTRRGYDLLPWDMTSATLWFLLRKLTLQSMILPSNRLFFYNLSSRFLKLLALEEAEDEAALRHRLTTWSLDRLKVEGYCITDLSAYWMQETQFGRPVATFHLGPGEGLPRHKFECVFLLI